MSITEGLATAGEGLWDSEDLAGATAILRHMIAVAEQQPQSDALSVLDAARERARGETRGTRGWGHQPATRALVLAATGDPGHRLWDRDRVALREWSGDVAALARRALDGVTTRIGGE